MLQTFRNAWKIDELRKKILFTLFILLLYRLGNAIPVPHVNTQSLSAYFTTVQNTVLGLFNTMSGGAFSQATIFALSIQPYINASIIIQLLCIAIPALERLSKEGGEEGQKKIAAITRYSTVGIGLLQGFAYYMMLRNNSATYHILNDAGMTFWGGLVIVMTFTAGSALVMWLGEQITEHGIGNGISMILFAGIVSRFPAGIRNLVLQAVNGTINWVAVVLMLLGALAMVVLIIIINDSERRIPVQYSKRVVGQKMYGGQSTHLPMKVNMSGVMPIIFAQSIASLPATICMLVGGNQDSWFMRIFDSGTISYAIIYLLLIIFFAYFYATIQFNPVEVANNLKKNGGFIPGYRPGKPTSAFIQRVLNKVTLFGAVYLGIIACVPIVISACSEAARNTGISLGGTSIIIVVGVALETVQALEAQMMMRNYKGFLD
ncbi:MAG: preprotein translocase subunit SecY [bacterium]|nr:preprotein translocase subunit SecY [bacterium]